MNISYNLFFTFFLAAEAAFFGLGALKIQRVYDASFNKFMFWFKSNEPKNTTQYEIAKQLIYNDSKIKNNEKWCHRCLICTEIGMLLCFSLILIFFVICCNCSTASYNKINPLLTESRIYIINTLISYYFIKTAFFLHNAMPVYLLSKQIDTTCRLVNAFTPTLLPTNKFIKKDR